MTVFGVILIGGGTPMFFHIPSIMFTLGIAFFLLLGTYGRDFVRFIPDAVLTLVSKPTEANERFAEIALTGARYVIGAGVLGALIGVIQMLRNLERPDQIGAGMAVALLSVFYAVIASEIFFAYLYKAYSDGGKIEDGGGSLPLKNVGLASIVTLFLVVLTMTLIISFA